MSLIKKPSQITAPKTSKVLVYGQPGLGKSTIALSAPSPLHLDFDSGVHRVRPEHRADTVQVTSWQDVIDVLGEDLTAYRSLVIDTAGKLLDYMSAHIVKQNPKHGKADGSLSLQGFGVRKAMFSAFLRQVSIMGKHLIFVAHEREEKDGDTKIIRPEIGGSSGNELIREIDLVGYMEARGKVRTISFDPCEKFYGKNTCGLAPIIEVPDLSKGAKNDLLDKVLQSFALRQEEENALAEKYDSLLSLITMNAESVVDESTANDFCDWVQTLAHIWDSKLQAGYIIRDKTQQLGLVMDKTTKRYKQKDAA